MAWFELHTNLPEHPKTMALEDILDIGTAQAVGHLCLLWAWALDNAPEGELGAVPPRRLARIAGFPESRGEEFVRGLVKAGFLDKKGKSLSIHDWGSYAGRYVEMKKKNAQRKRRQRQEKGEVSSAEENEMSHVTSHGTSPVTYPGTSQNVTVLQDSTEQDRTVQDITEQIIISAGGDHPACERETPLSLYFSSRSLEASEFLGYSPEVKSQSDNICRELFARFCPRAPTDYDLVRFYDAIREGEGISRRRTDLLCYAFEAAASAGKGGNWPYVQGVLSRLKSRGLESLRSAEFYDIDRLENLQEDI